MAVNDKELQRALVQLRRIAEHREQGAEKELRRLYRELIKELKMFLGTEYADMAVDGRLTFEALMRENRYAGFLEEIQRRLDGVSPRAKQLIAELAAETYERAYRDTAAAVERAADTAELKRALKGVPTVTPEVIKQAVENPIAGLTLNARLERNRRQVVYDIKRDIMTGLTNGDRIETMAGRIAGRVEGDYKKAVRIARTETHRVREAGMYDSAARLDEGLRESGADLRMVKIWRTMKDERVRPNHRVKTKHGWKTYVGGKADHQMMEGVTVLADEQFTLSDGSMADCPGKSGVASQDINCRCFVQYKLMNDEEFFKATGRHFPIDKSGKSDIINYARAEDIFQYENIDENVEITPQKIADNLETTPIGRETLEYIQQTGIRPQLIYEPQPHTNRGVQQGDVIKIFVSNTKNEKNAAQAVVHEITHHKYDMGYCQWAEVNCFLAEKMHYEGRNELTVAEKKLIIKRVKAAYPELQWKKGGYFNGKKF